MAESTSEFFATRGEAFDACYEDEAYWAANCNPSYRGGTGCTSAPCVNVFVNNDRFNVCPSASLLSTEFGWTRDNFYSETHQYFWCECRDGEQWNNTTRTCEEPLPPPPPPSECVGNPCDPATGNKYLSETDLLSGQAVSFVRTYRSQSLADTGLGFGWTATNFKRLALYGTTVHALDENGTGEPFTCPSTAGACTGDGDSAQTLSKDASGYTLARRSGVVESYNSSGQILSENDGNGRIVLFSYSGAKVSTVTYPHGHVLSFAYSGDRIASISDGTGTTSYVYDANGNLTRVDYPDGTAKLYHYQNPSFPHHLTGISYVEANGITTRYANYAYDGNGKAILTEHAGGMERFDLSYDSDTQTAVTDAAGTQEVMSFAANLGVKQLVSKVNQADGKSTVQAFDVRNNLTCKQDEEGRVTTYTYNAANQKTAMTEGLAGTCASPTTSSATRTTTYQYLSAELDLPTQVQTPSVAGGAKTVTIAYGDARFPTLPTAITQAGSTPGGDPVSRTVTMSYNSVGQVAAIDGPRTDVNDVTTLAYYDCTTGGACGQRERVTNALGHSTTYDSYDAAGRLTQMTDPNGLRTNHAYDARGRVSTITETPPGAAARVTQYTYNAAGNVTSVTFPDGLRLSYGYDAAQKLREITDNLGNRLTYNYDLRGNRTEELTYDPSGSLVRSIAAAYDLRNRPATIHNAGSISEQVNDAIGNLLRETDPNQVAAGSGIRTEHEYDALNRLTRTIDNLTGVTAYAYDVGDRLTRVQAPNNAATHYQYDDLGNLLQETSPDRGTTVYTYDAAGNLTTATDARGVSIVYTYDALNRLTAIDYPSDPGISLTHDSGPGCTYGIGRLCGVIDASGTTQYGYDAFGNTLTHQKTENAVTYLTRYTYDSRDRVLSILAPDNRLITYDRDALGRIETVTATVNGVTQPIVSGRTYRADGHLTAQSYGNGLAEVRDYNPRAELTYQSLGNADTRVYSYDPNGNLTQKQALLEVGNYTYDPLDRLTDTTRSDAFFMTLDRYRYDGNGNRTVQETDGAFEGWMDNYAYETGSNRLSAVAGTTLTHDPAGNLTDDGGRTFIYNDAGQLKEVRWASGALIGRYTYNYLNQRTRKLVGTATTVYHYDLDGSLLTETDSAGAFVRAYVYADGLPHAQIEEQTPPPHQAVLDNPQATYSGTWPSATTPGGYYGSDYQTNSKGSGKDKATWVANMPAAGVYEVYARWVAASHHASNAAYAIDHGGGTATAVVDQRQNGGGWQLLGTYSFSPGPASIQLTDKANGAVVADAIRVLGTAPAGPTVEAVYYLHTDHLGTPRLATNAQAKRVWNWEGEAFGTTPPNKYLGTAEEGPFLEVNLRFPGQYADGESGLIYNWNRYYDPKRGGYLQPDPISVADHVEAWKSGLGKADQLPLELNPYLYVAANPLKYVDPEGLAAGRGAGRKTRDCTMAERKQCEIQCAGKGVRSCKRQQLWAPVRSVDRGGNVLTEWKWKDQGLSCDCNEPNKCGAGCQAVIAAVVIGVGACLAGPWGALGGLVVVGAQ